MVGWVNLLQTGKLDPSTAKRGLDAIDRNTRIQAQLIEDLLDVSRIITGKLVLERDVIDLVDVAQAAAEGLRAPALARQLDLAVAAEVAPISVLCTCPSRSIPSDWPEPCAGSPGTPRGGARPGPPSIPSVPP